MRATAVLAAVMSVVPVCQSAERIDNVLLKLIPADSVTLFGARMDELKATPLYQKLVAQQKLPQLDQFAADTGFDARRDVRELLIATSGRPGAGILLARGSFHLNEAPIKAHKEIRQTQYRGYTITGTKDGGFCILDQTLAIAGPLDVMRAALDQYRSGDRTAAAPLVSKALAIPPQYQVWSVSTGGADFIANNMPHEGNASNFARIFRSLDNIYFQADLKSGFNAAARGECKTDADAKNLNDAVKGLVGFGRLSVPDDKPELLRLWDGINVEQQQKLITITARIPQDLIDKVVEMIQSGKGPMPPKPPRAPRPVAPPR